MHVAIAANQTLLDRSEAPVRHPRNHYLDVVRLVLAILVLLSHAPELRDGNTNREILSRLTREGASFGGLAVTGFFLLSGGLIVQSWLSNPHLGDFLGKRVLRIVPGYIVAMVLSIVICGVVAGGGGPRAFFSQYTRHEFFTSVIKLGSPLSPPIFVGTPYPLANGAVYTIHYEFICYCLVPMFGVLGLLKRSIWWMLGTAMILCICLILTADFPSAVAIQLDKINMLSRYISMVAAFFVGGSLFLLRDKLVFSPWLAFAAVLLLVLVNFICPHFLGFALILAGGYLLQYFSLLHLPTPKWLLRWPDISYGTYLYGWPTEKLWLWYRPADSPWLVFGICTCICLALGFLSWHWVEKPMLRFRHGGTAPLPAG